MTVTEVFVAGHLAELLAERRTRRGHRSHQPTTTSSAASGAWAARSRATCARRARATSSSTTTPRTASSPPASACASSRAPPPTTSVLRAAGIMRARAVIACVDSDAENIFITLSARELRPDIAIVARAAAEDVGGQAARARAPTRVISPYKASGRRWRASRSTRRCRAWSTSRRSTGWRRSRSRPAAPARAGRSPTSAGGAIIVGVRVADGSFQPQPPAERVLSAGDVRDGHGHRAHDGPPRARCSPRAARARGGLVTPVADLRAAVEAAAAGLWPTAGRRRRARRSSAPSRPSTATTRPTRRCCWRRCSEAPPREVAERLGGALRDAPRRRAGARRGRRPRLPEPLPRRRLVRRARWTGCWPPATASAAAAPRRRCASTSSSSPPTRPGR